MSVRFANCWLWHAGVGLLALIVALGVALVAALLLGFNSPRPSRPPDWEASGLPLILEAPPNGTAVALLGQPYGDLTLEIDAVPLSGPDSGFDGYGLIYRAQDTDCYYTFAVGSDGYYAVLRVEGVEETPLVDWQQFPHVRRGWQANRLRVACAGASCALYINDEYATTVEDDAWLEGGVGLWVRSFDGSAVAVRFEGARVWVGK